MVFGFLLYFVVGYIIVWVGFIFWDMGIGCTFLGYVGNRNMLKDGEGER